MMLPDRIEELVSAILDGEASTDEVAQLQALIAEDADIVATLADRIAEHRLLGLIHQPFDTEMCADAVMDAIAASEKSAADAIIGRVLDSSPTDCQTVADDVSVPRGRFKPLVGWLVAAISVCLLAAGVWGFLAETNGDRGESVPVVSESSPRTTVSVATVLLQEGCVWASKDERSEGQRLTRGRIDLERGTAVLRFDGGAELIMVGPSTIDLKSATSVQVHLGDVVVRADDGAEGFLVMTPTSEVIDLGTEFAVKVDDDGRTEVHVLDGEVSYRMLNAPGDLVKILRAGEGISIDQGGRPTAVPMNSPRFKEYVKRMNPRSRVDLLLAYEGFNYSPGTLLLEESNVGIGWAGPWRKRFQAEQTMPADDASPKYLEIVHGQLNVTWPVPGGRMGMLKLPAHNVYYLRPLKHAINLGEDGVTYFSLMVRETERPEERRRPRERLRLTFRSLTDYYGPFLSFGHSSGYQPRVRTGDGVLHSSPMILPPEQTTLWVGKILARDRGEDEICFRIYGEADLLGYAEPATWHVVTRGVDLQAQLDCVLLSSEGTTERIVDELRIGPTWRSVAPILEEVKN